MPDRVRSATIATDRGDFAVLVARPGHGVCERQPALLLPGYTGSKEDFLPVLEPLASAGRLVVAIDLRGQYQSPHAPDRRGYAPEELAADVLAVARALPKEAQLGEARDDDAGGVHLVGHSMGGIVARQVAFLQAAQQQPADRLRSLTLLSSGPSIIPGQRATTLRETLAVLDPSGGQVADDRAALARIVSELWREQLEPQARADGVDNQIIAFLRERMHRACPIGLIAMGRMLLDCPDRTAELAALTRPPRTAGGPALPAHVIYGENDDGWPPAVQDRMARRLGAQRACIPGAAHSPAIEAPDTTTRALTTFWNEAERHPRPHKPA